MLTQSIENGISLFTVCKNRNSHLVKMLESAVKFDKVNEIVIVDWSSDESLKPIIKRFEDKKIILAEVPGQNNFLRCHAFNLAARLTGRQTLLKIDADVKITSDFFSKYSISDNSFYAGKNEQARNRNEDGLCGLLYIRRKNFFKVNGYNEYLTNWGSEDTDVYNRLVNSGLNWLGIDYDYFKHIPHGDRISFSPKYFDDLGLDDDELEIFSDEQNKFILKNCPWNSRKKMTDYNITKIEENIFRCEPIDINTNVVSENIINDAKEFAIRSFVVRKTGMDSEIFEPYDNNEILDVYKYCFRNVGNKFIINYIKYIKKDLDRMFNNEKAIQQIKTSYSWMIGNTIVRIVDMLFGWIGKFRKS